MIVFLPNSCQLNMNIKLLKFAKFMEFELMRRIKMRC